MSFIKSFSIYTISGCIVKGVAFLLLPFFTRYLSQSEYGVISIFSNSIYFIAPFMGVGIGETFSVEYPRFSTIEMKKFVSTSFFFPILIFVLGTLSIILFGKFFETKTGLTRELLFLVIILSVFNFFADYIFIVLRNKNEPILYAGLSFVKTIIELLLAILLIKYWHQGAMGRVNSIFFSSLLFFLFVVGYFIRNGLVSLQFSKHWFKIILRRGIPAIPFFFMIFILTNSDKYMINYYYSNHKVGEYSLAWQFAMIISMIISAFTTPFYPFLYECLDKKEYKKIFAVILLYVLFLLGFILVLIFIIPFIFQLLIDPKFYKSIDYIPLLLFGQLFWALFIVLCGFVYYKRKNTLFLIISPATIVFTIATNYILLVYFPIQNFAVLSFVAYLFCFLVSVVLLWPTINKGLRILKENDYFLLKDIDWKKCFRLK